MKRYLMKLFALITAIILLVSNTTVFAASSTNSLLRYEGATLCKASLNVSNYGYANCSGELILKNGVTANMTLTLLKSSNGITWTTVTSWSSSGSSWLVMNNGYYVMSGYYYMTKVSADLYDSNGVYIEHITEKSSVDYY